MHSSIKTKQASNVDTIVNQNVIDVDLNNSVCFLKEKLLKTIFEIMY